MISAVVVADSVSVANHRLTTIEATFHRFILPQVNTHRVFSRGSASSRAVPIHRRLHDITARPALPMEFGKNQPGMQAESALEGIQAEEAAELWLEALAAAKQVARRLNAKGVHKQVVNRLLEPFQWHTAIISSTEWGNFFDQRLDDAAQPEMQALAQAIYDALGASTPNELGSLDWHIPYVRNEDLYMDIGLLQQISVARCARVSYLNHNQVRDIESDLNLYNKLVQGKHYSPFEHVAHPDPANINNLGLPEQGNFLGWRQLRHEMGEQ